MTTLQIPRALVTQPPLSVSVSTLYRAEGRIHEVAYVTVGKAPELLACLNEAWAEAAKALALVEREHVLAKRESDRIRSVVLMDRVQDVLRAKGLATAKNVVGSADLRQAVLDADEEYRTALDRVTTIKCFYELIKGKQKAVEMAFTSVKKIVGEGTSHWMGRQSMSAGNENDADAGDVTD